MSSQSTSPFLDAATPTPHGQASSRGPRECRLCAQESDGAFDIFGKDGRARGLPDKIKLCLPILVRIPCNVLYFCRRAAASLNVYVGLKCTTTPNQRLVTLCTYAVQQSGIKIMNNCDEFGHTLLNICAVLELHSNAKPMIGHT